VFDVEERRYLSLRVLVDPAVVDTTDRNGTEFADDTRTRV